MLKSVKSFSYYYLHDDVQRNGCNILVFLRTFYVKWFMMTWWDVQCSQEICYFMYLCMRCVSCKRFSYSIPIFSISKFITYFVYFILFFNFYKCMNCIAWWLFIVLLFGFVIFPYLIEEIVPTLAWFVVLSRILSPFSCVKNGRKFEKRNGKFMFAPTPTPNLTCNNKLCVYWRLGMLLFRIQKINDFHFLLLFKIQAISILHTAISYKMLWARNERGVKMSYQVHPIIAYIY